MSYFIYARKSRKDAELEALGIDVLERHITTLLELAKALSSDRCDLQGSCVWRQYRCPSSHDASTIRGGSLYVGWCPRNGRRSSGQR